MSLSTMFSSPAKVARVILNVSSFAAGASLGIIYTHKRKAQAEVVYEFDPQMEFPWDDTLVEETSNDIPGVVMDADVYEALITPTIEMPDPNVPEEPDELSYNEEMDAKEDADDEPAVKSVFSSLGGNWDMEAEMASRSSTAPYVLHEDEFLNDERGYTQSTLTYYTEDNILTDESDVPVYPFDSVVGELKFGHGTNSAGVVYIRNESLQAEYEVLRVEGSYESELLGLRAEEELATDELKHSDYKFRSDE